MAPISAALGSDGPLEHEVLSSLARKDLRAYLQCDTNPPTIPDVRHVWHRLLQSANTNDGSEKYLTAACNAISVFLTSSSASQSADVRSFAFSGRLWQDGYDSAQKAFEKGKTKPALQVLETLCRLLNDHADKQLACSILHNSVTSLLKTVLTGGSHHLIKIACIQLSCFVRRTQVGQMLPSLTQLCISQVEAAWTRHLHQHNLSLTDVSGSQSDLKPLLLALLMAIRSLETRSAALKLLTLICTRPDISPLSQDPLALAASTIKLYLERNSELLGDFADNIFPVVLDDRSRWQTFVYGYESANLKEVPKLLQLLVILRVGKLKGFVADEELVDLLAEQDDNEILDTIEIRRRRAIMGMLRSSIPAIRIGAYSLITATQSTTAHVSVTALDYVKDTLTYLHDDNDAHNRGEILSVTRRLLRKMDATSKTLAPSSAAHFDTEAASRAQSYHEFFVHLIQFCKNELRPGVSYARHSLALNTLEVFLGLEVSRHYDLKLLCKPLFALISDPYEDVRAFSAAITRSLLRRARHEVERTHVRSLSKQLERLSTKTCRHDHADAAGRVSALVFSFDQTWPTKVSPIEELRRYTRSATALTPGSMFPLHALLIGAGHHLAASGSPSSNAASEMDDIVRICHGVWRLVRSELCVDSPETATSESEDSTIGPKDLLAYSWRALRDSSVLLQAMMRSFSPGFEILDTTGSLCIEQLTMLRHRGAFSAVALTFALCCEKARSSSDPRSRQLNQGWYHVAIEAIEKQGDKLTRRSAGLPALINAVSSPSDPSFFAVVIRDLISKASDPPTMNVVRGQKIELPQVHAMNCIKDIIHNSRFGSLSEQYIGELLQLGATSISSEIWAIRNCGLMLLKACMVRLDHNGSTSHPAANTSNNQRTNEEPLHIAMDLLASNLPSQSEPIAETNGIVDGETVSHIRSRPRSENVFAALDLVRCVGHASTKSVRLRQLIKDQLNSPIWAIREHAARLLVNQATTAGVQVNPSKVCPIQASISENELHGQLLFYRYCLQYHWSIYNTDQIEATLDDLDSTLRHLAAQIGPHSSPYTGAAILDIVNDSLSYLLRSGRILADLDSQLPYLHRTLETLDNAYCRARLFLNKALYYLLNGCEIPHRKFVLIGDMALESLSQDLCSHPDEARYVLEQLREVHPADAIGQMRMTDFLCRSSCDTIMLDTHALALTVLAEDLETQEQMATYFCGPEMKETRDILAPAVLLDPTSDRDTWNATLRVSAFLLRAQLDHQHELDRVEMGIVSRSIKSMMDYLHVAGQDLTEYPTRLSAALTLRTCLPQIVSVRELKTPSFPELVLAALMILYDQLNDDDEEVRKIAEESAAMMMHRWHSKRSDPPMVWFCALRARESILHLLQDHDWILREPNNVLVPAAVSFVTVQRLVGVSSSAKNSLDGRLEEVLVDSLHDRFHSVCTSMNDLFAEERQNLYVDELREIAGWKRLLRDFGLHCSFKDYGSLVEWLMDGMAEIKRVLQDADKEQLTPFGPTYNFEILTLCVRVVSLVSVVGESPCAQKHEARREVMRTRYKDLKAVCEESEVHERLLAAFDVGPETSSA